MLRGTERKEALESLSRARTRYESQATDTQTAITDLFLLRQKCSKDLIARGEHFVNRLANTPKEFDKSWSELKAEIAEFDDVVEKLEEEYRASHVGKGTAAAGVAVGAGVAAFAPTAALAIATTFGTASTGTAIATLSGAAATNAALAWLGGGALAAGGGGMSAGSALLALAGPVGWGSVRWVSRAVPYWHVVKTAKSSTRLRPKSAKCVRKPQNCASWNAAPRS
jgi:hypothetical protein